MGSFTTVGEWNVVTVIVLLIVILSVLQGARRGATGSARQLYGLVTEGAAAVAALYFAWMGMKVVSPAIHDWLVRKGIEIPNRELSAISQLYYTFITSLRDFTLMRSAVVFVILYFVVNGILGHFVLPLLDRATGWGPGRTAEGAKTNPWTSLPLGALIGALTGAGRALLFLTGVVIFTSIFPDSPVSGYASQSLVYQKGAKEVIEPLTGGVLSKLPVFAGSVQDEFNQILKRKYEVLDARIPDDIAAAAQEITARKTADEDKAKALYQWIGTRVKYDWNKVQLYEDQRIWKEQTPEDTFKTRLGVCIDYSRLYAVMARSVGLQVKVVTGLGADGRGGYGSHAWNEVYLSEKDRWVPLDSTWVSSGGNWFNPSDFYSTHIKEA